MMHRLIYILLFFTNISLLGGNFDLRSLSNKDGLSNSSVNCIFQDSFKILWFGTWDGLNLYNGHQFTIYKPDPSLSNSIDNNIIRNIIEGERGILWIATDNGINKYNSYFNSFENFLSIKARKPIFKEESFLLAKSNRNRIFAAVYEMGVYYYDSSKNDFISLQSLGITNVKKMFFDSDDFLWLYTNDKKFYKVTLNENEEGGMFVKKVEQAFSNISLESVFYIPLQKRIYLQKSSKELLIVNPQSGLVENFLASVPESILSMYFDSEKLYVGTAKNLYQIDIATKQLTSIISNHAILCIFKDTQGIIWLGTDGKGVMMMTESKETFESYSSKNLSGFASTPIRSFYKDHLHRLWVGTKGDGLFVINENGNDPLIDKTFTSQNGLLSNSVYALSGFNNKELWIGTEGNGLNYYHFGSNQLHKLQLLDNPNISSIYAIYQQNDSTLWVGTSGYGLYQIIVNREKHPYSARYYKQFVYQKDNPHSLNNNIIYSIIPSEDNSLWVSTRGGGLNKLNVNTQQFVSYRFSQSDDTSISSDDILCMYRDQKNTLWIGTSMGLNELIEKDGKVIFRRYSEKTGIPNNTIHGILEDKHNDLWLSTNKGISKLNAEQGKVISYFQGDGLQDNEFSDGAYYTVADKSEFYFGGINGYNKFDPFKISKNTYMPPLYLDVFSINNIKSNISEFLAPEKEQDVLELGYKDKVMSFTFSPLDYLNASKCDLAYYLENYNEGWIQLGSSRTIVFSNLPSGNYTLHVKWTNADKEWVPEIYTLKIRINPPFWLSWYAYLLYFLLAIAIILLIRFNIKKRMEMRHKLMLQTLEKQKTEEIHQSKLRFFTNIAHEFCNSLTLIYGPCEQLLKNDDVKIGNRKYLNIIKSNAERMQGLIQQLMEFRKVETGYLGLNIEQVDIPELVRYTSDHFVDIAEQKKINFEITVDADLALWTTDRDCLEKILFNLLSNAFKYTPANGKVELFANQQDDDLVLSVKNTGAGIKVEDQKQIFNRFTILDRIETQILKGSEPRTGIGLAMCKGLVDLLKGQISVESHLNDYTCFEVKLPMQELLQEIDPDRKQKGRTPFHNEDPIINQRTKDNREANIEMPGTTNVKPTVLIVDDDDEIRYLINDILQEKYNVILAEDGLKALEAIEKQIPDLILCDIIMPNINGVELVRRLKTDEVTSHIPIIFLTSEFSVESQIEGISLGADAYITKPFHSRHLEVSIKQLLQRKQGLKQYYESPVSTIEKMDGKLIQKKEKDFIMKLTRIVSDNIENEKMSLEMLAHEVGVSKIQLYRKLKEINNQTPTEFIRNIRLEHARKLLQTTKNTVQEIMYSCGFNNKAYFYREFAKQYKQTPKEYRSSFNKDKISENE